MKFQGHLFGGVIAGAVVTGIAVKSGAVHITASSPWEWLQMILYGNSDMLALGGLFMLTVIMSLFPDLDTASIPQRWFYRSAYLLLIILVLLKQMALFAVVTFILLLPLLHRHRGWTHARITPVVMALFMVLILGYIRIPDMFNRMSVDLLISLFHDYWIVMLACVMGHYTHLAMDSH